MSLSFECIDCRFFTRRDDLIEQESRNDARFGKEVPYYVGECNRSYEPRLIVCWNGLIGSTCDSWYPENEEDEGEYGNWVECQ